MARQLRPLLLAALLVMGANSVSHAASTTEDCPLPSSQISLAQAIDRALCANPSLKGAWLDSKASQANEDTARASYLPTISAGVDATHTSAAGTGYSRQANVGLSWLLYDFGGRKAQNNAAREVSTASLYKANDQAQALALSVSQNYFSLQAAQASVAAATARQVAAKKALALAQGRHKEGIAIKLDVLQAQNAVAQADLALAQATVEQRTQQAQLAMQLSVPAHEAHALTPTLPDETSKKLTYSESSLQQLIEEAQRSRSDVKAAMHQANALQAQTDAARAEHLPKFKLVANTSVASGGSGPSSHQSVVGLNVSIPLFEGGATQSKVRSLENQAQAQAQRVEAAKNQVGYEVASNWHRLQASQAQLTAAQSLVKSASEAQSFALERYRAGVGTMLEVFDSLSQRAAADEALIKAQLQLQANRAQLARSLGVMPVL